MSTELMHAGEIDLSAELRKMQERVAAIEVRDQASYMTAAQSLADVKTLVKDWERKAEDEIDPIKSQLDRARNRWKVFIEPGKQLIAALSGRLNAWKEEERRKAAEEERRINEERRIAAEKQAAIERAEREKAAEAERKAREKEIEAARKAGEIKAREAERLKKEAAEAAEREKARAAEDAKVAAVPPPVQVRAAIPTAAGVKNQIYYFAELQNGDAIISEFASTSTPARRAFLRQFITIDEQALGKFARDTKDSKKAASLVPGVKFTQKG